MKESITRRRRAASVANVGSQCDLSLKIPGKTCEKINNDYKHFPPLRHLHLCPLYFLIHRDQHRRHDRSGDQPIWQNT